MGQLTSAGTSVILVFEDNMPVFFADVYILSFLVIIIVVPALVRINAIELWMTVAETSIFPTHLGIVLAKHCLSGQSETRRLNSI